jgi:hypothetical protein
LNLPDVTVAAAGTAVQDWVTWEDACSKYATPEDCAEGQFYFKNSNGAMEWLYSACEYDEGTSTCVPNHTLTRSYGVK